MFYFTPLRGYGFFFSFFLFFFLFLFVFVFVFASKNHPTSKHKDLLLNSANKVLLGRRAEPHRLKHMGLTEMGAINLCLAPANPPRQALAEARDGVAPPNPWHCAPHPAECLEPGCGEVLIHSGGLCRAIDGW